MKPPAKVDVGPYTYDVVEDAHLQTVASVTGVTGQDIAQVRYAPDVDFITLRDTVMHELMHAITYQLGYTGKLVGFSDEQEEHICNTLAPRLLELLRDNPALVKFFLEVRK